MKTFVAHLTATIAITVVLAVAITACGASNSSSSSAERATQTAAIKHQPLAKSEISEAGASKDSVSKSDSPTLDRVKALIQGASHGRTQAVSLFDGPMGLTGVVTAEAGSGAKSVVFTNIDGTVVLPVAVSETGGNLVNDAMESQHIYDKPADILTEVAKSTSHPIMAGTAGPVMTVFMDPNCSFCRKLFDDFQGSVKEGKVRIRFILLGFLKQDSAPKSAAILAAKNPLAELTNDETKFDEKTESGATVPSGTPDAAALAAVSLNGTLMGKLGPISTPGILSCSGGKVVYTKGAPVDPATFIAGLSTAGHDACGK